VPRSENVEQNQISTSINDRVTHCIVGDRYSDCKWYRLQTMPGLGWMIERCLTIRARLTYTTISLQNAASFTAKSP
jgi:hypothetical protein